ncbi:MAG: histidine kinase [Rhizobiaceae bacterium]
MPSLIKFIVICGILAALAYGGMFALATMVEPEEREIRIKIPSKKINP